MLVEEVLSEVGQALDQVERELREILIRETPHTREIALHLAESGGKRVRPIMTLLAARVFTDDLQPAIPVATAAEMIHMATLVHDDVIDGATIRRGRFTVNQRWGNPVSVLTGDILLAKALVHLVDRAGAEIVKIMADMLYRMCEGEVAQNLTLHKLDQQEHDYFDRIEKKTALFFGACCRAGARISGAGEEESLALERFGRLLGMAFQIIDDVLDVSGEASVVGKPVGHDLASGVFTLPVLYCLNETADGSRVRSLLSTAPPLPREVVEEVLDIVRSNGAIEYAYQVARDFAARARAELVHLPPGRGRELLESVADYSLQRRY